MSTTQPEPRGFVHEDSSESQYGLYQEELLMPLGSGDAFAQPQLSESGLFWPDAEGLLENIMSLDPALWDQPMSMLPSALGSHASPVLSFEQSVYGTAGDEGQRAIQSLSAQLSSTLTGIAMPATLASLTSKFLDSCLHMFFSTFEPMLPVIHQPTFVFQQCSPALLLNAIAIGSLFLGTKQASEQGDALWRLAHTAVATSWHSMVNHRGEYDAAPGIQLVQTSLLSQVYAVLSKSRTLRMTGQVFHGLGFYWARHCGLFDLPEVVLAPGQNDPPATIERAWRLWVARERQLRALLGMYIMDGVISQYSGNPTFAQHMSNPLPMPGDELAFAANSATEWLQHHRHRSTSSHPDRLRFSDVFRACFHRDDNPNYALSMHLNFFALKVVLEGIKSLVAESKRIEPRPVGVPSPAEINLALERIRIYIATHPELTQIERLTAMVRWHAICLDTWKVAARGARRLCFGHGITQHIFGGRERVETDIDPQRHIDRDDARRTLLHAREIQRITSQLPLGLAHDPHVPGAVFAAATTYAAFALAGKKRIVFPNDVDWRRVVLSGQAADERATNLMESRSSTTIRFIRSELKSTDMATNTALLDISYELSAIKLLIRGLSLNWGVCEEMESVVDAWIAKCT